MAEDAQRWIGEGHYGRIGQHECEIVRVDPLVQVVEWIAYSITTGEEVLCGWSAAEHFSSTHTKKVI